MNSCILGIPSKRAGWGLFIPCMAYSASHLAINMAVWRYGPMIGKTKSYLAAGAVFTVSHTYVSLRLVAGASEYVLFGNRLIFCTLVAVGLWGAHTAALLGFWALDHPAEPHRCTHPFVHADGNDNRLLCE